MGPGQRAILRAVEDSAAGRLTAAEVAAVVGRTRRDTRRSLYALARRGELTVTRTRHGLVAAVPPAPPAVVAARRANVELRRLLDRAGA